MFHWTWWIGCCGGLAGKGCFTGLGGLGVLVD